MFIELEKELKKVMPYFFLEDVSIAEIAYRVEAATIEELFRDSALALTEVMVDISTVEPNSEMNIEVEADNIDSLLYRFLNRIVAIKDSEGMLFKEYSPSFDTSFNKLRCKMKGERINSSKHELRNDVKGVSMHLFGVEKNKDIYSATVVLDI
jgi:SHS2 domain-containing protein